MANAVKNFVVKKSDFSEDDDLFEKIIACAKEENVTPAQYVAGMLWHALRGHDLSKIHFYQDGSGDTYDVEEVRRTHEQAMAESAAGLTYRCETREEGIALLNKWKEEALMKDVG
jgi:hypothetical protein